MKIYSNKETWSSKREMFWVELKKVLGWKRELFWPEKNVFGLKKGQHVNWRKKERGAEPEKKRKKKRGAELEKRRKKKRGTEGLKQNRERAETERQRCWNWKTEVELGRLRQDIFSTFIFLRISSSGLKHLARTLQAAFCTILLPLEHNLWVSSNDPSHPVIKIGRASCRERVFNWV